MGRPFSGPDARRVILDVEGLGAEVRELRAEIAHLTHLVTQGFRNMATSLEDLVSAVDTATNTIAAALGAEGTAITAVSGELAALRAQLAAAPTVTTAVLDKLADVSSRLTLAASTIGSQTAQLQAIGADPANPVPTPAPSAPTA